MNDASGGRFDGQTPGATIVVKLHLALLMGMLLAFNDNQGRPSSQSESGAAGAWNEEYEHSRAKFGQQHSPPLEPVHAWLLSAVPGSLQPRGSSRLLEGRMQTILT